MPRCMIFGDNFSSNARLNESRIMNPLFICNISKSTFPIQKTQHNESKGGKHINSEFDCRPGLKARIEPHNQRQTGKQQKLKNAATRHRYSVSCTDFSAARWSKIQFCDRSRASCTASMVKSTTLPLRCKRGAVGCASLPSGPKSSTTSANSASGMRRPTERGCRP